MAHINHSYQLYNRGN